MLYFFVPTGYVHNFFFDGVEASTGAESLTLTYGYDVKFIRNTLSDPSMVFGPVNADEFDSFRGDLYRVLIPNYKSMTDAEKLQLFFTFPFKIITDDVVINNLNRYILGVGLDRLLKTNYKHPLYEELVQCRLNEEYDFSRV